MRLTAKQELFVKVSKTGKNIFLTGGAGTGKSVALEEAISALESEGREVIVCAPTGIAALNIGGVTIHREFKLPLQPIIDKPERIPKTLKDVDALVIDEVSMVRLDIFDYIGACVVGVNAYRRKEGRPDLQVIVCGDFFQLPPVITDKDREILEGYKYGQELGRGYAFQSEYWGLLNFINIELDEVIRQADKVTVDRLNSIRVGDVTSIDYFNRESREQEIKDAILVCGTNRAVDAKNQQEYDKIDSPEKVYKAKITGEVQKSDMMVPEQLSLKAGCRVMFVVNDTQERYSNGTLGTVMEVKKKCVNVVTDDGVEVDVEPFEWSILDYEAKEKDGRTRVGAKTIGTYTQIPLKLAYAVTVHKSQGQTYQKINLNPYAWDCGQLYVALSRVKSIDGLHLTSPIMSKYLWTAPGVIRFYNQLRGWAE